MAAVALPSSKTPVFNPFHMASHHRLNVKAQQLSPHVGSSSRSPEPSTSSQVSAKETSESTPKTFKRLRSSLEQSLRSATRSKSKPAPPIDDFATISPAKSTKGKEKIPGDYPPPREKEKTNMLRRLESKVGLRRAGRESVTPSPSPMPPPATSAAHVNNMDESDKIRAAGYTSFITPSLRQASMSSPALHFSGSPSKPPSASSSSSTAATPRDRTRRSSVQPSTKDISSPSPLVPRREGRGNGHASPTSNGGLKHGKARPSPIFVPPPGSPTPGRAVSPESNSRKDCELPSPPDTPTPVASSRGQLSNLTSKKRAGASATHLPLGSPPASPTPASTHSVTPTRARSPVRSPPARRVITPTQRGLTSASATHLPLVSPSPPTSAPTSRRPSIDAPRRPSIDSPRRPSIDSPRRPSIDASRRHAGSPIPRAVSPSAAGRPRAASPSQRASSAFGQNRHFNVSTASLVTPSNPEQRDLIRTATSILCKEFRKAPAHLSRSEGQKEWAEVELRMRPLIRLERIWGKSGAVAAASSGQVNATGGVSSTGFSVAGEERERRLFGEALRDGVVLCQLINKFRPNTITRIDTREDGIKRSSNIPRFLASCSSQGVPSDDTFYRDDINENTPETLTRVARTIIALVKVLENPTVSRAKVIAGQGKPNATDAADRGGPYAPGSISRAASSTPNLVAQMERSVSPTLSPTGRKRWTPPSPALPTVRSDSPASGASSNGTARNSGTKNGQNTPVSLNDREVDDVPPIKGPSPPPRSPPPRSPLRTRSQSKHSEDSHPILLGGARPLEASERFPMGSNGHFPGDYSADPTRQSRTSSNLTDTTAYSSLLEFRRNSSSGNNKFGTIRTMTTEATSFASEMPSFTRTEASSVAASLVDEMSRKRGVDNGVKIVRERRPSESAAVDLTSLAEEEEVSASGSSSRDAKKVDKPRRENEQQPKESEKIDHSRAIRLGKGKWPDDFLDAFQQPPSSPPRAIPMKNSSSDRETSPLNSSPLSGSPARKLAIVGASRHNDSGDSVQHAARRPTHRARHSLDAPILMPKESILRRDVSPDAASVVNSRVMLRRQSTRTGAAPHRNGVYYPRGSLDDPRESGESLVPFPRAVSGEHGARALSPTPSPDTPNSADRQSKGDAPRMRGRFQSEIEGSSARRSRPSSYDELGKTRRSRFESMINLGVASSNASASDLLSRDSMDGSAVRQTLVVKEEGKPATHFQLGNCIGRGQFGSVYRALNLNTGQMVAVKRIRLEGLKEDEVTQLMKEVDLVKSLSHPSIVKYEGMARDEDTLNIVLEYAENGSLGQTLKAFGKLNERLVASYVVKILEGLHYLHQCDVVHCDLKAANILTTKNGNVKLSDFGVSLNLRAMEREIKDVAGTPNWMAPEVIELKGASTKSDIWSLACTVIELLTGRPPYAEIANSMTVMFRIVEDQMPPLPEGCSEPLQDFLKQCFHKDPVMRPSAELLCEHYWLKKNWDALKELRPQDSIPFLRRVSADIQKSDVARYLAQMDLAYAETPLPESPSHDIPHGSPPGRRRLSNGPNSPIGVVDESFSPREHTFVKTTFSKPMICRVCLTSVKKSAVICEQCSLIAHSKCAHNAPPTCDLRSQLLLYAQYAEKGNPGSAYSNPMEGLNVSHPPTHTSTNPMSEVSFVTPSPRPSMDVSSTPVPGQGNPVNPPTAFKFIAAFKRSRSSLSVEPGPPHSASPSPAPPPHKEDKVVKKRLSKLKRSQDARDRPHSMSSNSTSKNASSMRSGPTAPDSYSSRQEPGRKSFLSVTDDAGRSRLSAAGLEDPRKSSALSSSAVTDRRDVDYGVPGALPAEPDRQKKRDKDKSAGCTLQ